MNKQKLYEFLKKNDYLMKIQQTIKGIKLILPTVKTKFGTFDSHEIDYIITYGKIATVKKTELNNKETVKMPKYAVRLFICSEVMRECSILGFDSEHIEVSDKEKFVGLGIDEFLSPLLRKPTRHDLAKEETLSEVLQYAVLNGFTQNYEEIAKERGILEGFQIISKVLQGDAE